MHDFRLIPICGYLYGYHQEQLGSTTINRHGVLVLDFATVSGWPNSYIGQTHTHGGNLNLLITDVPDLDVADVAVDSV